MRPRPATHFLAAVIAAPSWSALTAQRVAEHQELSIGEHRAIIDQNSVKPRRGDPPPLVIFKDEATFERAMSRHGRAPQYKSDAIGSTAEDITEAELNLPAELHLPAAATGRSDLSAEAPVEAQAVRERQEADAAAVRKATRRRWPRAKKIEAELMRAAEALRDECPGLPLIVAYRRDEHQREATR